VAALLGEHFVCVLVDREERPEVDQLYMAYTLWTAERGGWPLTVLLTPDQKPFFASPYLHKRGDAAEPGLLEILPASAKSWREERARVRQLAERAMIALAQLAGGAPGSNLDAPLLERAEAQLTASFDAEHGGFGAGPKFPLPLRLSFLLRRTQRTGDARALAMVAETLAAMRRGAIWDQLGYGFHRSTGDATWLAPHFEKLLCDQALIAIACIEAWQLTGDAAQRDTAERTFEYVLRELASPEGAFYSVTVISDHTSFWPKPDNRPRVRAAIVVLTRLNNAGSLFCMVRK
jgi:uncharacterized protein YyaL (SSP411 family)